jgi:DNA-binding beta-propeller fold protein YncE
MTNQEFIINSNPSNQIMLSKSTSINNYILFFILLLIIGPSQGQQYEYLVTTLAGGGGLGTSLGSSNGLGTNAKFYYPSGISLADSNGNIYVADTYNHLIRKISR